MKFAQPLFWVLLIIPLILAGFFSWCYLRNLRDLGVFASKNLLPKIVDFSGTKNRRRQWVLRVFGIFFLILAIGGPLWGYQWDNVQSKGLEILFALDTSKSMLATDVKPNRLERAKLAMEDFLEKLGGNKVGLVAFAGSSFLQCPLTIDYSAFHVALDSINVQSIPRGGTAIGSAIATAREAFKAGGSGDKILILITDGENHEGEPVAEAQRAAKAGIHIYTIGIGSLTGEPIPIQDAKGNTTYIKDASGLVVKTVLNEKVLREIASAGNGAYFKGEGLSLGLAELYQNQLLKRYKLELTSKRQKRYKDRFQIPLFLALVCFFGELALGYQWRFNRRTV